jgi:SAM-dependent methyltransferase
MNESEFDKFAAEYEEMHASNIRLSGETPDYFARYKTEYLAALCQSRGLTPNRILDYGTGIGASLGPLRQSFPNAEVIGLDVSARSLEVARRKLPENTSLVHQDAGPLRVARKSIDLVLIACVLHHVDPLERANTLKLLLPTLGSEALVCIFEHNPFNPITRHLVASCPFDANAILLSRGRASLLLREMGLQVIHQAYTVFFPHKLRALRRFEPYLSQFPLGGQYCVVASSAS